MCYEALKCEFVTNTQSNCHVSVHRDRFRTTINVMCDALGTIIVDHLSKGELGGNPVRIVRKRSKYPSTLIYLFYSLPQEEGEPHELQELRHEKE